MGNLMCITIDCKDAKRLGTFWAAALDGYMGDEGGIVVRSETGPILYFQEVPEGKTVKNRVHLDIGTDNREGEEFRLERNGASVIHEGDEFCVCPA